MRKSFRSMRHAVEGDTSFSATNCRTDFRVGDEATLARMVPTVLGARTRGLLALLSCLSHSHLRETAPPTSSPCSLLVPPCTCTGFWTGAGIWKSNLFAKIIPQFVFSALSLVAEPFWMTSQRQVLPSMEKILMYDDYIELCTFSIVCRSNKIDSNWLKHPVRTYLTFAVCLFSRKTHLSGNWFYWYHVQFINNGICSAGSIDRSWLGRGMQTGCMKWKQTIVLHNFEC